MDQQLRGLGWGSGLVRQCEGCLLGRQESVIELSIKSQEAVDYAIFIMAKGGC